VPKLVPYILPNSAAALTAVSVELY